MSAVYLAVDPRSLADRLADDLDRDAKAGDFFRPATIVVPNRYLKKWLRLWLARRMGVAINLEFQYLEEALWTHLREVDPAPTAQPETIDENIYRLMVLSVLLEEDDPDLGSLRRYMQLQGPGLTRLSCRRAWDLAERIGARVRDYEYNRQDLLIQPWLVGKLGLPGDLPMERAQRAVFRHITREPDGKRALLNRLGERAFKTFPQYAMELMTAFPVPRRRDDAMHAEIVHFFGFTQVNELHARTIAWLGKAFDVRFHHLNVLVSRCGADLQTSVEAWRSDAESTDTGRELMRLWGVAGTESLWLASLLQTRGGFNTEHLPIPGSLRTTHAASVLGKFRAELLGVRAREDESQPRLTQDTSLQIIGCPGVVREVETAYNSIVHNLQCDPALRQTDIAIVVTDMSKYRAALEATFEAAASGPLQLQYNLVDFSAAGISLFGQALLGMLDLALESFSRARVFEVVLNPCFLASVGASRDDALVWLDWAEKLGIYQGWDADEKAQQGYARSPLYAWRLGLQRLRLGRFMDVAPDDATEPARRFGQVIPFADLESGDREQLDAFCRAIEGLLPALAELREAPMSGERWARTLERLADAFLEVPADLPEESQVRAELLRAFETLARWDDLHDSRQRAPRMPLALVREYVQTQLEVMPGNRGEYLSGGVSIAELQPMRPVPFEIVYILGLSENLFPGSNALSSFDLRGVERLPGDVRPAEARLYDFLATALSTQRKLYLLYNNFDLQKEQPLLPAVPLQQLQRFLNRQIVSDEFQPVAMPMDGVDFRYFDATQQPVFQDVLVQHRDIDRAVVVQAALDENRLALDADQAVEWRHRCDGFRKDFTIAALPTESRLVPAYVTLAELRRFLVLPGREALRRHLGIGDDYENATGDDEPLVTNQRAGTQLIRQTIRQLVLDAAHADVDQALGRWQDRFAAGYTDARLRSQVPEEAFGEIDQAAILRTLQERVHGQGRLESFLRERAGAEFCGPILVGESLTPIGARLRFPALRLRPDHELPAGAPREIRIGGSSEFAWQSPGHLDILIVTTAQNINGREIDPSMIEPTLFYLALLANADRNAAGISSQRWVAEREVRLHVAHAGGIQTWTHPMDGTTAAEAMHYLVELTRDFLDPGSFDLIPLEVLLKRRDPLLAPCRAGYAGTVSPETYRALLEGIVREEREGGFSFNIPPLVQLAQAQVPADALAKVQRRFYLLDRAPARVRETPKFRKIKRPPPRVLQPSGSAQT